MIDTETTPGRVRWALEFLEERPVDEVYAGLLSYLSQAGLSARLEGIRDAEAKIAVAYKLAVELGGKLTLLNDKELAARRRVAAVLFGEN